MRYLNKIVFINSATIPYAEVLLDGNIHFIGTQGVGKSTILRAILYFYNADSRKLGIPKGPTVKSFADWYLRYANSYLVYEVARETGAYCVLAFKSQNRVCYRFIDTAYQAAYFMNEAGEVHGSWDATRQKLDAARVNVSPIVNSFEQYRDILYGNFMGKSTFKKYALLEARQYKNIYRTIQNVFLNTKLDATEIKQTIISSMEDEQISIDLDQYDHHLKDFETNLNDIRRFRYPSVQKQAARAIEMRSAIRHLKREQETLAGQLRYRLDAMEAQKPQLISQKTRQEDALRAEKQTQQYESSLYQKRKDRLNDQVSQLNGKLKEADAQRKYYAGRNIDDVLRRVERNRDYKTELEALRKERDLLTHQFSDIRHTYEALIAQQSQQMQGYTNQKASEKVVIEKEELHFISSLNGEYEKLLIALEQEHRARIEELEATLRQAGEKVHRLDKQQLTARHQKPYEQEMVQAANTLGNLRLNLKEEENKLPVKKQQIEAQQGKWNYEKADAQHNNKQQREKIQAALRETQARINDIEDRITKSRDSLYGWLNQHKPGWEQTIGKVVDEQLLFRDGLSPSMQDEGSTLYGLSISLSDLECKVKSMDDYRFELEQLNATLIRQRSEENQLAANLEKELDKLQRRNLPGIKALKEEMRQSEYHCEQLGREIEKALLNQSELEEKARKEQDEKLEQLQQALDKAVTERGEAAGKLQEAKRQLQKQKDNKQREKNRRIKLTQTENKQKTTALETQVAAKQAQVDEKIQSLKDERNNVLNQRGANTGRLTDLEKQMTTIENELAYIEQHRDLVSEYKKDKRELFDREKDFKNEKNLLADKLEQLRQTFATQQEALAQQEARLQQQIKATDEQLRKITADEEKFQHFAKSSAYRAFEAAPDTSPAENEYTAIFLIDAIGDRYYQGKEKQEELKISIDKFLSHFSEGNIFQFPTKLIETDAYLNWAVELNDFIEEDKIDEFEKRTNERFADIISTVGKETTLLISKTGEIKKIINKINADFKGKRFLEAVTNIELDIKDSKHTAVLLLKRIKDFNDDNFQSLGASNLFSGTDHDKNNSKAVELLRQLVKEINQTRDSVVRLADSFELSFRVEENGNDTGWVEKLSNVGSEGTDVLVKAMINIMLLNVFKEGASRRFKDFKLHCMMDEVGKLHPNNVKGILNFANDRNILLINGSPTESTPLNYRHIYKISKDANKNSRIKRIISNPVLAQ
ncbi:DNA repair exonuclease SbcCD ATPase subunit [Saccharicrinis carchari]|uniref:DNA repair exonuclease SbcCD ATPase subunit n=1 Tax=Saccharicrinis carchari TaxID=1168039 RepID=A0A521AYB1_SACCC|nr:ATP-binding protein [Saccharicrinis carchari]SMO39779.1 DNA repair exonuclease SbcCD ATPase subunit [Saccharicrinis carchari]